ncbi:MAG: T9SS type A sorting domain-containing protein [Flavobacteriales bacterium]|nr:T9SS type A sorting domain-containing protein [Flavobacteriales bacterium]
MLTVVTNLVTTVALAQMPFALDTSFRTTIQDQYVNSLLVVQDGKVIISGNIRFPGDMSVRAGARLDPNGARDPSFPNVVYMGGKLVPWNDRVYSGNASIVRRHLFNGSLDPAFIMMNSGPYFLSLQGGDYHVYPDGRVLISGKHTLNDVARGFVGNYNLIWFSNTGYLDTTRVHRRGNGVLNRFKQLPDGGFIISGNCTQFDGEPVDAVFRTDADGVPDTTFHTGVYTGIVGSYLPLMDGRVYVGGRFKRWQAPQDTLLLVRFMHDGSLDPSFNMPQFTLGAFPVSLGRGVTYLYPWDDGRIIAAGTFHYVNGLPRSGICMLDSTGAVLDAFDDCGIGPFTYQGLTSASVDYVVRDTANNFLYLNGAYTGYSDGITNDTMQRFVTRLHVGDITTNITAKPALQWSVYPNPASEVVTLAVETLPRNVTVIVRDALGREMQRHSMVSYYTTLDLKPLPNGIYHIELFSDRERIGTQRVVMQH